MWIGHKWQEDITCDKTLIQIMYNKLTGCPVVLDHTSQGQAGQGQARARLGQDGEGDGIRVRVQLQQ